MAEPTKNKKALIVDDDKFLLGMYSIKFSKNGYDIETATDGEDALNKLKDGTYVPDVIMVDIIMPIMDGIEFLQKLREGHIAESSAVVVLTNQSQSSDIEKAKAFHIDGYIIKATSIPSEVLAEVNKILEARGK